MSNPTTDNLWRQVNLCCADWKAAEQTAVRHLRPHLIKSEDDHLIDAWWFVRKGACWRLRYRPHRGQEETATKGIRKVLDDLLHEEIVHRWAPAVYEPEIHAFGGPEAMDVAHTLFHADSHCILTHLAQAESAATQDQDGDHRRELGLLLAGALLRAAEQDWYEQGDVWQKVAVHRTASATATASDHALDSVRRLITARTLSTSAAAPARQAAFEHTGKRLAILAAVGDLTRGLRAVLAHHILFAWNRAGISAEQQGKLATAAAQVIFHGSPVHSGAAVRPASPTQATTPSTIPAVSTNTTDSLASDLRARLVEDLRRRGGIQSPQIEAAFNTVPRHRFLPEVELEEAYAPRVVITKRDGEGTALSSASQPNLVAWMLEQLDVRPGHRVLEVGTATGINAALLAELVGEAGAVTTIEIDSDLADRARQALQSAGYTNVTVVCGDGAEGYPPDGPYDRIIVTAGAWDVAPAWWQQLAVGGRIVVPLVMHSSGLTRSIAFDRTHKDQMLSASVRVCGFVDMRGSISRTHSKVTLTDDLVLHRDVRVPVDEKALRQAFNGTRDEYWTNVRIIEGQPTEHLDLWLTTVENGIGRLSAGPNARQNGMPAPTLRWSGASLYNAGSIAYLVLRELDAHTEELGIIAYGTERRLLIERLIGHLGRWDKQRPDQPTISAQPRDDSADQLPDGYLIEKTHSRLSISW